MTKTVLRFFFDYGAGGCLWAGDAKALAELGPGPVDIGLALSKPAQDLRDQLDFMHSGYLNPLYPPDPSLWTQALCDRFNSRVETLLALLHHELGPEYDIQDRQPRYSQDPCLAAYLADHPNLSAVDDVTTPTVR